MEMEGRSFSEMYRNTSEEMFIKTMMESPVGMAAPTMEMLGFKNITQGFRADSEEIFKSWLTTGENSGCHATGIGHRPPRQASRRISTELASLCNQNAAANAMQKKINDDTFPETTTTTDSSNERSGVEKGAQATNLFLAKAWFHSCQPMTRSRSSELRRRYVAMQNSQTQIGIEACAKQQQTDEANGFNYEENHPTHFNGFMSFNNNNIPQQVDSVDKISSVVSMLKGTLDRKKLTNQVDKEGVEESSLGYYTASCFNQGPFQDGSILGDDETRALQTIEESLMEGIIGPLNHPTQISNMSREASQSESSAVVVSNGFDMFDDHCISTQAPTLSDTSRNQMGTEDCSRTRDVRERIYDHTREDQKQQESLVRYGSIKSSGSVERGDPTKKRRVERSRKMAEAKEKSSTPPVPSDVQSILKRCENLEKEVRSLKLNLAFMNRKDSEQTKQIEELQKQNQELADEKERLLEEIERIISETGKM